MLEMRADSPQYFDDTRRFFNSDAAAYSRRPPGQQATGTWTKQIGTFRFSDTQDVRVSVRRSPMYGDVVSMMFTSHQAATGQP
ncbi:hypothetical protein B0919_03325 [Hymenobacter sp. CRA2]|nr:hypothetical protein B0919_03325 [Hymenobacter sp. CRA2]